MSWLLFLDESGTDRGPCPYEVTGGVAIHASRLWPFIKDVRRRERDAFGGTLHEFGTELKGCKLLEPKSYRWADQGPPLDDNERQRLCRRFLVNGRAHKPASRIEFTAYGQARLAMARWMMEALVDHGAVLFAAAIPRHIKRPRGYALTEFLRKDHVFLLERFFYFLERERQHGILVMDAIDKGADRSLARRMESYFEKTAPGRLRSTWIVPSPFFVSSDMAYPVQAADLAIYCVNWGYRLAAGMAAHCRDELRADFEDSLRRIEFHGDGEQDGRVFKTHGIVCVPDPYAARQPPSA
jgi:hypothetical protein